MASTDPAVEAARRAWATRYGAGAPTVRGLWDGYTDAAWEALNPIRAWWESGNGRNFDDLLPLIYTSEELNQ